MQLEENALSLKKKLATEIADCYDNPLGFVHFAFPWNKDEGPDRWQSDLLRRVGNDFIQDPDAVVRESVASGHGIGKSAIVAWLILWAMSTRPHLSGVVTANTEAQLKTKTWRELAVWHKRAINHDWFQWTATKFYHIESPETWFVSAIPWSEQRSEGFAGLHADHVLVIYDEASAIPDCIWEVSEGAMTTPRAQWYAFGNPTKNTGRFRECFGRFKHRWQHHQIDSRQCKMTNKTEIQQWVDDYGEDSDFVRVRVRGEFPRAGSLQFISSDHVAAARARDIEAQVYYHMPVVMGVDVARFGDDQSVICVRQGRKVLKIYKYRDLDTVQLSARVIEKFREHHPKVIFVDVVGIGAGVVDQLISLGYSVHAVNGSHSPDDQETYFNKRAEMWGRMKAWLAGDADIPDDPELADELTGLEYGYTAKKFQIQLEKKEDMKKRGLSSPDNADALAMTFAAHVSATIEQTEEILPDECEMESEI